MFKNIRSAAVATQVRATLVALFLAPTLMAQGLVWGEFPNAPSLGAGSTVSNQTLTGVVPGFGNGTGSFSLNLSVAGGTNAWNGFGVGRNDDGYFSGPNMPIPGITFTNGGPGYGGGIPLANLVAFASGYNLAGAPANTPAPRSDRSAIYFDAGDGTTMTAQWDFGSLLGSPSCHIRYPWP